MSFNNSPSSRRYKERKRREQRAAAVICLAILKSHWPDLLADGLPLLIGTPEKMLEDAEARGLAIPRRMFWLGLLRYCTRTRYRNHLKRGTPAIDFDGARHNVTGAGNLNVFDLVRGSYCSKGD